MIKYISYLLILIIAVAMFFRFWQFGQVPAGSYWDETAMLIDAKAFTTTGLDHHGLSIWTAILPSYGDYKLAVYPVITFMLAKIFGPSLWVVRLPSLIAGLLTIVTTYLLAKRLAQLTDWKRSAHVFGLSAGMVVATSPWAFVFSRTGFESHLAQLWLALASYFAISQIKPWVKWPATLILATLSMLTYYALGFVWPVVIVSAVVAVYLLKKIYQKSQTWHQILSVVVSVTMVILVAWTSYLFFTQQPLYANFNQFRLSTDSILNTTNYPLLSNQFRQWAGNHFYDRALSHRHFLFLLALTKNLSIQLSPTTLFFMADQNLRHSVSHTGLFLWPGLLFMIIGFLNLLHKHKVILVFLGIWITVGVVPASVPLIVPHSLRALPSLVPLSLIIGWGVAVFLTYASSSKYWALAKILVLTGFLLIFSIFIYTYFSTYPVISQESWQTSYKLLARQVFELRQPGQKTLGIHPDGLLYLWFMAYGPYSGSEFMNWPQTNYQLRYFDNIYFDYQALSPDQLSQIEILVGRQNMVADFITQKLDHNLWSCTPITNQSSPVDVWCQKYK